MLQNSFTKWENSPKVTKATAWQLKILLGTGLSSEAETVRGYAYPLRLKLYEDGPILLGRNCTKMGLFFEALTVRRLAYLLRLKLYKDGSILWGWNCSMIFKEMPIVWGRNCSIRFVNLPLLPQLPSILNKKCIVGLYIPFSLMHSGNWCTREDN